MRISTASQGTFDGALFKARARSNEPVLPGTEAPMGVTMIVGGTNVRFVCTDGFCFHPVSFSLSWTELAEKMNLSNSELFDKTDEALNFLAGWFIDQLQEKNIPLNSIDIFGLSVAGLVEGESEAAKVSTVNTGVKIHKRPLLNQFVSKVKEFSPADFDPHSYQVRNDAVAGILGETLHPGGCAYKAKNAVFVIIGTGIGGAGITNGSIDSDIREFGHTFFYRERMSGKSTLSYHSFDDLQEMGLVNDGKYEKPSDDREYIETYIGGPQLAIRFAKHFGDEQDAIARLAVECLKIEGAAQVEISEDSPRLRLKIREIQGLAKLDPAERVLWGTDAKSLAVKQIGKFLISLTLKDLEIARLAKSKYAPEGTDLLYSELVERAWEYREKYMVRVARFLGEIGKQWPQHKVIVGGGVMEGILNGGNYPEDLKTLRWFSGLGERLVISELDPETREASFVTDQLKV